MTTTSTRFWAKVQKPAEGCWAWTAGKKHGYGWFNLDGRNTYAHRYAYEALIGPIPEGLVIDHLCRNRACVNPAHLEPVTNRENVMRGEGAGARHARKSHCIRGHSLEDAYIDEKRGWRRCRVCIKAQRADYRRRKTAQR